MSDEPHIPDPIKAAEEQPLEQPVRVEMPEHRPVFTNTILVITIFVFLLQMSGDILREAGIWEKCPYFLIHPAYLNDLPACYGMKVNIYIAALGEWWRLFTPMLLHGGLLHVGFNMYALYILGGSLERFYGHWQFLTLYIVSGFAGTVASFAFTDASSLGASTAVFGLIGAQGVFAYKNQKVFGPLARQALRNIITLALFNLFIGYSNPGIDNWGHIGGLVGGVAVAWFGGPQFELTGIRPNLSLQNQRGGARIALAGLGVLVLFAMVAGSVIGL
jgi:rhomboid protease GluP